MRLRLYLLLDSFEHKWRKYWKVRALQHQWGDRWQDMSRKGRTYTRVSPVIGVPRVVGVLGSSEGFIIRPDPGWEWNCPNCKDYSRITEADMPAILRIWEIMAQKAIDRGYKVPRKPTAATAGCPNCNFLPGDPE